MREVLEGDEELKTNFYFPIPEPGIVVKGLDIVNLNGDPSVKMMEENENRRESFGASYTLSYIPDPSGGHKEFIMIDQNYRPISLHRQEKSAWDQEVWRFVYDEQGRLIEKNDELYIYESDQSDDSGHFTYKTEKLR